HTMKQPSGPATSATPMPPTSARVKKSSSIAAPLLLVLVVMMVVVVMVIIVDHAAVFQMDVVVIVAVDGERGGRLAAEQSAVLRALCYRLRRAGATHVAVQADYRVGPAHDDM